MLFNIYKIWDKYLISEWNLKTYLDISVWNSGEILGMLTQISEYAVKIRGI